MVGESNLYTFYRWTSAWGFVCKNWSSNGEYNYGTIDTTTERKPYQRNERCYYGTKGFCYM